VPVPGVDAQLFEWPHPSLNESDDPGTEWPIGSKPLEDYYSRTASNTNLQGNLYYDLYTGACMDGPGRASVDSDDWYRIEMRKDGYEPYFNYLYHDYDEERLVDDWGGQCSGVKCEAPQGQKLLDYLDWGTFKLWPHDEEREKLPDLFVDRRQFTAGNDRTLECAVMDPSTEGYASLLQTGETDLIALRVGTSVANVGSGPLHVEQAAPGDKAGECANGAWPCPDGFTCQDSDCVAESCGTDGDCPEDMECGSDGECRLPTCTSDSDCCDAQGNCAGDSRSCEYSGTCKPYLQVRGPEPSLDCSSDGDGYCRYNENVCEGDTCKHEDCQDDSDCSTSGTVCHPDLGKCATPEETDRSCASGSECKSGTCNFDTSEGVCEPATRQVIETVEQTDSSWIEAEPSRVALDNSFTFHYAHDHTHLDEFVELELRDPDTNTIVDEGQKISFCLMDSQEFDNEIRYEVRDDPSGDWEEQTDGDPCYFTQGISPGYKDVYGSGLPGQSILLGKPSKVESELAGEDFEIKVEVDPGKHFIERTRANNTASALYEVPDWSSTGFCEATQECRGYPAGIDNKNDRRICERYANYYCNEVQWDSWCDNYPPRAVGSHH